MFLQLISCFNHESFIDFDQSITKEYLFNGNPEYYPCKMFVQQDYFFRREMNSLMMDLHSNHRFIRSSFKSKNNSLLNEKRWKYLRRHNLYRNFDSKLWSEDEFTLLWSLSFYKQKISEKLDLLTLMGHIFS